MEQHCSSHTSFRRVLDQAYTQPCQQTPHAVCLKAGGLPRAFLAEKHLLAAAQTKKDPVYAWKALRLAARESLLGVAQAIEPLAKAKKRRAAIDLEDIVHKLLPVRLSTMQAQCLHKFSGTCPAMGACHCAAASSQASPPPIKFPMVRLSATRAQCHHRLSAVMLPWNLPLCSWCIVGATNAIDTKSTNRKRIADI